MGNALDGILIAALRGPRSTMLRGLGPLAVLIALVAISAVIAPGVIEADSLVSFLSDAAPIIALVIGGTLPILAGSIDLSVAGVASLTGVLVVVLNPIFGPWTSVVVILIAMAFGATQGFLHSWLQLPSFIVTLGTLFAVSGLLLGATVLITGTTSIPLQAPPLAKTLFGAHFGSGFQVLVIWWVAITAAFVFFVHLSRYGNWIFAIGGDSVSARNAGIPTGRITILLFVLSSVCASFVGMSQAILFQSVQATPQLTLIFNTIIAVVVGGVLLTGGFGSVIGIFLGTITFAVVTQGIYYTDFDQTWSNMVIGVLLLGAVLMNNTFRRLALSAAPRKKGA